MGLVDCLSRHPLGLAPKLSELDIIFVVLQIMAFKKIFKPAAKNNSVEKDRNINVICKTKVERELGHRKECTANTFIDAFLGCHLIKIVTAGHVLTESCGNCKLFSALETVKRKLKTGRRPMNYLPQTFMVSIPCISRRLKKRSFHRKCFRL